MPTAAGAIPCRASIVDHASERTERMHAVTCPRRFPPIASDATLVGRGTLIDSTPTRSRSSGGAGPPVAKSVHPWVQKRDTTHHAQPPCKSIGHAVGTSASRRRWGCRSPVTSFEEMITELSGNLLGHSCLWDEGEGCEILFELVASLTLAHIRCRADQRQSPGRVYSSNGSRRPSLPSIGDTRVLRNLSR